MRRALLGGGAAAEWEEVRAAMLLEDIVEIDEGAYDTVLDYEREAAERGYPELR